MLLFGFPQMVAVTLTSATNTTGNLFINNYSTADELGIYNLGLTIVSIVGILRTAFTTFWLPTAYKWEKENKSLKHYEFISDLILLVFSMFFFLIIIFMPTLTWVIGENYNAGIYILPMLMLQHVCAVIAETTSLGIVFSRKTYLNVIVAVLTFIMSIALTMHLTPIFGYHGASITTAITYFIYYILVTMYSRKTGFYFKQKKSVITLIVMFIMSLCIMFDVNNQMFILLALWILSIIIQKTTIKRIFEIKSDASNWDFT